MINMAFMPLYMWEMWDVTAVTNGRTDGQWESRAVFSLSWIRNSIFFGTLPLASHFVIVCVGKQREMILIWKLIQVRMCALNTMHYVLCWHCLWTPSTLYSTLHCGNKFASIFNGCPNSNSAVFFNIVQKIFDPPPPPIPFQHGFEKL